MRNRPRGTIQVNDDVKRLFMLAKPMKVTSSVFLKEMLLTHARQVRETQLRAQRFPGLAALAARSQTKERPTVARFSCLGRPPGAKDLKPRTRRTMRELARQH
jgi:hypothetical protein